MTGSGDEDPITRVNILRSLGDLNEKERLILSVLLDIWAGELAEKIGESREQCKLGILNLIREGLVEIRETENGFVLEAPSPPPGH